MDNFDVRWYASVTLLLLSPPAADAGADPSAPASVSSGTSLGPVRIVSPLHPKFLDVEAQLPAVRNESSPQTALAEAEQLANQLMAQ